MNDLRVVQFLSVPAGLFSFWYGVHALLVKTIEAPSQTSNYAWLFDTPAVEASSPVRPDASQAEWPALFGEAQQTPIPSGARIAATRPEGTVSDWIQEYRLTGVIISETGSIAIITHNSDIFVVSEGERLSPEHVLMSIHWGMVQINYGENSFELHMFEPETQTMIAQQARNTGDDSTGVSVRTVDVAFLREQRIGRIVEDFETDVLIYMGNETNQSNTSFQWLDDPGFIE